VVPLGIKPHSAEHLVRIFSESMGVLGTVIFGVGLWGVCFSSFVSGTMGYSLIVRDICRRFVPLLQVAADSSTMTQPSRHDPVYRWSVAFLGLSPLYIVFLGVEPVALTLVVRSMVVIVIPVLVGSLMKMANNRTLMGEHRPGLFSNAVMALLVVVSVYLTARDSGEWWHTLVR
jgi:Mn2+/Fe2+ NRAMP family transporter